jgi:hypothetical protein
MSQILSGEQQMPQRPKVIIVGGSRNGPAGERWRDPWRIPALDPPLRVRIRLRPSPQERNDERERWIPKGFIRPG